ncbi:hypothetical protein TELCIR_00881 [Teladorsagia circumcincta]|uniref:Secreted protein n=1 Tax=Teladorsagia circumcincta TaxID=45464 RepID=A0A2G9V3N4_TELCI|nr:hypothetical protein TELCIR_00881 [Teladorsagia circumcincta]
MLFVFILLALLLVSTGPTEAQNGMQFQRCASPKEMQIVFLWYFWWAHGSLPPVSETCRLIAPGSDTVNRGKTSTWWDRSLARDAWKSLKNTSVEVPGTFKLYATKYVCFILLQQNA